MFNKVFLILITTLAYIFLLTIVFEYCISAASSNLLTAAGVLLFLLLTWIFVFIVRKTIKK